MNKQQDQITPPKIECEELTHAGQDDEIADLFLMAHDVIETRGIFNLEGIKQWLPAYTNYKDLKEALHPLIFDAVIKHAIQQSNK
jgi:hypothetical protein